MEDEAEWIVTTAAKIKRDEIRDKKYDCRTALSRPRSVIAPTKWTMFLALIQHCGGGS